jgi:hypothetical protein
MDTPFGWYEVDNIRAWVLIFSDGFELTGSRLRTTLGQDHSYNTQRQSCFLSPPGEKIDPHSTVNARVILIREVSAQTQLLKSETCPSSG